jgi:hypothetical protein
MEGYVRESRLAEKLGVGREVLRGIRKGLREGEDWRLIDGSVQVSESGVRAMELALGGEACRAVVVWTGPKRVRVRVARMLRNPRVVEAVPVDACSVRADRLDNGRMRLRVGNKRRRLCAGLIVEAEWVQADLWEMVGRAPRSARAAQRAAGI